MSLANGLLLIKHGPLQNEHITESQKLSLAMFLANGLLLINAGPLQNEYIAESGEKRQ